MNESVTQQMDEAGMGGQNMSLKTRLCASHTVKSSVCSDTILSIHLWAGPRECGVGCKPQVEGPIAPPALEG